MFCDTLVTIFWEKSFLLCFLMVLYFSVVLKEDVLFPFSVLRRMWINPFPIIACVFTFKVYVCHHFHEGEHFLSLSSFPNR